MESLDAVIREKLEADVDFTASLESLSDEEKGSILSQTVAKLFNTIGKEDTLRKVEGQWFLGDKELRPEQVRLVQSEIEQFRKMSLYHILDLEVRYHANKKMAEAQDLRQLDAAKMIQYTWDVLKSRLNV